MVRKGIGNGLTSEIDMSVDRFFALYADNMHRHGTPPFSRRYFARLREVFGDRCEVLIVVDAERRPVSGVLSFYFRDEVSRTTPATRLPRVTSPPTTSSTGS
jgi:predicted N-acyltransferase